MNETDVSFLKRAIELAAESVTKGGFPAGAVIVKDGKVIGQGLSIGNILHDPTSHGEMAAIRDACKNLSVIDLSGAVLYDSMQPCLMCFGAFTWCGISKIIYACSKHAVTAEYYMGHYETNDINRQLLNPVSMIHMKELEAESLAIVRNWENSR